MIELISKLNNEIIDKCMEYVAMNRTSLAASIKPLLPTIQNFALWFIRIEDIGVSTEIKNAMNNEILELLDDMVKALENDDSVLLYDTLLFGIVEYLKLFIPEGEVINE